MKTFEVKVTNGLLNAPSIYVDAQKDNEAEERAREKSGLGRFYNWEFIAI